MREQCISEAEVSSITPSVATFSIETPPLHRPSRVSGSAWYRDAPRSDVLDRHWSSFLLATGSICGFCGFFFATLAGQFGYMRNHDLYEACFLNERCPSNRSYHAETVSELVSGEGWDPPRLMFYSFTTIASICLIVSRYPWELRNVYVSSDSFYSLNAWRAILPPLGMMTVAQIPVIPRSERDTIASVLACNVHTLGAVLFVAGYNAIEFITLRRLRLRLSKPELFWRFACVVASSGSMLCFALFGALYGRAEKLGICCGDKYEDSVTAFTNKFGVNASLGGELRVHEHMVIQLFGKTVLVDSAKDAALLFKKIEFWSEEVAGMFILISHLLIWYYSEERHLRVRSLSGSAS